MNLFYTNLVLSRDEERARRSLALSSKVNQIDAQLNMRWEYLWLLNTECRRFISASISSQEFDMLEARILRSSDTLYNGSYVLCVHYIAMYDYSRYHVRELSWTDAISRTFDMHDVRSASCEPLLRGLYVPRERGWLKPLYVPFRRDVLYVRFLDNALYFASLSIFKYNAAIKNSGLSYIFVDLASINFFVFDKVSMQYSS